MIRIEDLRQVSDNTLSGLTADESLKFRILQEAAAPARKNSIRRIIRPVPVLCSLIALLVVAVVALSTLKPVAPSNPGEMNVFAAGSKETDEPFFALIPDAVSSVEISSLGTVTDPGQCASLVSLLQKETLPYETDITGESCDLVITDADGTRHRYSVAETDLPGFFSLFRQYTGK